MSIKLRLGFGSLLLVVSLIFIGSCLNSQAYADTVDVLPPPEAEAAGDDDFPPGEDQIVPLALNERAPFAGQLFETSTAIRWGFRLQTLRLRLDADVAAAVESCAVQTELLTTKLQLAQERFDFDTSLLRDERDRQQVQIQELTKALAEADDTPWYETAWFGAVLGVTGTLVLGVVVVYALDAI